MLFYLSSEIVSLFISNLFFYTFYLTSSIFYLFHSFLLLLLYPLFISNLFFILSLLLFFFIFFLLFYLSSELFLFLFLYTLRFLFLSISTFTSLFFNGLISQSPLNFLFSCFWPIFLSISLSTAFFNNPQVLPLYSAIQGSCSLLSISLTIS